MGTFKIRRPLSTEKFLTTELLYSESDGKYTIADKKQNYGYEYGSSTECPQEEKVENLYGYEEATPTPRSSARMQPRRSSLKNSSSTERRRASISYRGEMTLVLPTGEKSVRRTSISFEESENQTKEVIPASSMVDNPYRLWFQAEEYNDIKREIARTIKKSRANTGSESPCTRGLEPIMYGDTKESRVEANTSVLDEYSSQKIRGEYNGNSIRQIYMFHTIDAQVQAERRGRLDQEEIQNYLKDTRTMYRRMTC